MSYKINKNKYLTLKLLERAKKSQSDIIISDNEYNYFKENVDENLECEFINNEYYWYIGQDHPSLIDTIVTDNSSPGWRYTGISLDEDYEFNTTDNPISDEPSRREEWYIALPVGTSYHIWDDRNIEQFDSDYITDETIIFKNVTYKIYKPGTSARKLSGQLIKK